MKVRLAIFLFLIALPLLAEVDIEFRVSQLEHQMLQVSAKNATSICGANIATSLPEVDGKGWFVFGEVLRWCAKMDGTEFVSLNRLALPRLKLMPCRGSMKSIKHPFDWGIRGGVGCNLGHNKWNGLCRYTHFSTKGRKSLSAEEGKTTLIPLQAAIVFMIPSIPDRFACSYAHSRNELNYHILDLELKRGFFVSGLLALCPHFGIKSARIEQRQNTHYIGESYDWQYSEDDLEQSNVFSLNSCCSRGIGLDMGVDSDWHLSAAWSLYSNISGGLLFGHCRLKHHAWWGYKEPYRIDLVENRHCWMPSLQMQCGVRFARYNKKCTHHIAFNCGFETHYWWRQSQSVLMIQAHKSKENLLWKSEGVGLLGFLIGFRWSF